MSGEGFKDRGVITKIYMKNFTSYNEVVFRPGRNLNVITGPNGTGKSTLVAAIALGLGGNVKVMGKSGQIKQYVKRGEHTAVIEIELRETPTRVITINRTFTTENKSTWTLNKQTCSEAKIAEVTKDLNIQIGNLCQFLPQDKVKSFTDMNPKQLLLSTEESVGDPKLYQYHQKLMESRAEQRKLEDVMTQRNTMLDLQTQKYHGLEEIVSGIKERKVIKKKIVALGQKRAWILYDSSRKALGNYDAQLKVLKHEIETLNEKLKPTTDMKAAKELEIRQLKNGIESYNLKINRCQSEYRKKLEQIENEYAKISEIRRETKQKIEDENRRENNIMNAEMQKNKLGNDLSIITAELGTVESITEKSQEIHRLLQNQRRVVGGLTEEMNELKQSLEMNNRNIAALQREHRQLGDVAAKRLNLLKSRNVDAWKGVLWLHENSDKFKSTVHEPIMLNIQVKDEKYAKYFENIIATRDLYAFVCEDKDDMNLLLTCLREQQNLVINVVHSDPHEYFDSQPRFPIDSIRSYGFQDYLLSLVEAPATIIKYLITMYGIHQIPIGTAAVDDNIEQIPADLSCYFSLNNVYSVRVSKYTGDKSIRTQRLGKASLLSIVMETGKMQKIEEAIKDGEQWKSKLIAQIRSVEEKLHDAEEANIKLRNSKAQYQQDLQKVETLHAHINIAINKIQQYKAARESIDNIKANSKARIMKVIESQMEAYARCNSLFQAAIKINTGAEVLSIKMTLLQEELAHQLEQSKNMRENLRSAEIKIRDLRNQIDPLRRESERLLEEAKRMTDGALPHDCERFRIFKTTFGKLPGTIEEIDDALQQAQARVYCLKDHVGGEDILRDYERTEKNVQTLKQEIETLGIKLEVNRNRVVEMRNEWLPSLQTLVDTINTNFSKYFRNLGCVGEVLLTHGENPMDFEEYEMKIRVKFRDDDELKDFTKERQSGGERSVTTAIYMISLQELSRVPFRCVDEINQAMDAANERRVFDLIVEMTSNPDSAQYFLLTPKLLPNLKYTEQVRVHVVMNGAYVVPWNRFNTVDYCEKIAAKRGRVRNSSKY